jgi:pyruvate/2-oxoglutarate dehydrogenase complex dihydrolipoamide acyltransferase (E2) component
MEENHSAFTVFPFPTERQLTVEGGQIAAQRHTVYGLLEVDVTGPRALLREHKARTGETISFTAFVIACLGKALDEHKRMHAYRDWRNRIVVFDEADVNTIVEIEFEGRKMILPHLMRAVNKRTLQEIHTEIREVQAKPQMTREMRMMWFLRLPRFVRHIFYGFVFKNPFWLKKTFGTVGVTAIGMFGNGGGWAIPFGTHTLNVALGGIAEKPGVVDGRIEIREYLCVTMCFDHDVIDGAPAARFTSRFKELIESGYGLDDRKPTHKDSMVPEQKAEEVICLN